MQDRVSLHPGRVKLTPVAGQENTFDLVRADQPTQEGTQLNKATLLKDSTEISLFGKAANRTVDEAFAWIAGLLNLIKADMAAITLTVQDTNGKPIPEVLVQGILSESGQDVYTNANGVASGVIGEGNSTIKISNYADILDYSESISVTKGSIITKTITVTTRNFLKILSSQNLRFSANVETVDVSVCSGGGSGAHSATAAHDMGGGGGGHTKKTTGIVPVAHQIYNAIVGAGGASVNGGYNGANGVDGGISSFMGVSADSGKGGKFSRGGSSGISGAGNGNGGYVTNTAVVKGTNGTETIYKSYTELETCGGGGGGAGGVSTWFASAGGSPGGGKGGTVNDDGLDEHAKPGVDGIGGGGGASKNNESSYPSGKGGNGSIAIRMHLKSAT